MPQDAALGQGQARHHLQQLPSHQVGESCMVIAMGWYCVGNVQNTAHLRTTTQEVRGGVLCHACQDRRAPVLGQQCGAGDCVW